MPAAALVAAAIAGLAAASSASAAAPYGPWAHTHFVWLSSDPSPSFPGDLTALLAGYAAHNISVGAVDIDSGWATGYNTFVPLASAFPDWYGFIAKLKAQFGVRVILWMTSMIDHDSPNFAEALANSFFVLDGFNQPAVNLTWWHGTGGLLDYSNPAARRWWEDQMAPVLRGNGTTGTGVDGWKCDGTDPYIIELLDPRGAGGVPLTFEAYSSFYYGHSLNFSRTIVPDALIWSRPVDSFPIALNLSAFLEYSPRYVMFSGWVGDQDPTFSGLKDALINIFMSAWHNYTNYGSDTGGYRTGTRTRELFCRWAQLNAFLPLFENGGNGDHTPWGFDAGSGTTEVTDMYRELVGAHYALAPYFYSTGVAAFGAGLPVVHPTVPRPADFPFIIEPDQVPTWSYLLGPSLFVYPVTDAGATRVSVELPGAAVSPAGWADFWDPSKTYPPGASLDYDVPLSGAAMRGPVFVAAHALLPLHASSRLPLLPRHAGAAWAPALTLVCVLTAERGGGGGGDARAPAAPAPLARGSATLPASLLQAEDAGQGGAPPFTAALDFGPAAIELRHGALHPRRRLALVLHLPPGMLAAAAGARRVRWARSDGGADEALAERPAVPPTDGAGHPAALFWDDAATSLSPALGAQYDAELGGTFTADGDTLAVMLTAAQARAGGRVTILLHE